MPNTELYGLGDEDRTLLLLRVLNECAQDAALLDFGLTVMSPDAETDVYAQFLRGIAAGISERVAPFVGALGNEYLILRADHNAPLH